MVCDATLHIRCDHPQLPREGSWGSSATSVNMRQVDESWDWKLILFQYNMHLDLIYQYLDLIHQQILILHIVKEASTYEVHQNVRWRLNSLPWRSATCKSVAINSGGRSSINKNLGGVEVQRLFDAMNVLMKQNISNDCQNIMSSPFTSAALQTFQKNKFTAKPQISCCIFNSTFACIAGVKPHSLPWYFKPGKKRQKNRSNFLHAK